MTDESTRIRPGDRDSRIFERIATALERIAAALEHGNPRVNPEVPAPVTNPRELRNLIREGDVLLASRLLDDYRFENPDAPELEILDGELSVARARAAEDHRKRLDAARTANDPEGVLSARDRLAELILPHELDPIDGDIVKWIMGLLMKRMRTGTVGPDVAILAARVADSLGHRAEGASLRASLPTLRRSAGLCARCAGPYDGVEDACPKCLAGTPKIAILPESPTPPA